ncbi:helix-turn-helix domain-containing protein [Nocardioides sp. T2.26MG-1]|uniref:helix-turn-helix domain-containing protein n=1 Tax=Nocardioides sp. T2.26MG-1 TaxID=3041166 RepID=UPI002541F42E|nr:helix-turn-helix domain-containing protein [Nocardioides sp. T2.26MG-1]
MAGLLRRVGIVSRPATTEKSPTVKVPFAEHSALIEIGVKLPSPPGSVRVKLATGQETLDVINARRRAEQEERTRRALILVGDTCPPALRQAGELRLLHPELSLEALGELMDPPATRHAVCGQLRRLHQMASRHQAS